MNKKEKDKNLNKNIDIHNKMKEDQEKKLNFNEILTASKIRNITPNRSERDLFRYDLKNPSNYELNNDKSAKFLEEFPSRNDLQDHTNKKIFYNEEKKYSIFEKRESIFNDQMNFRNENIQKKNSNKNDYYNNEKIKIVVINQEIENQNDKIIAKKNESIIENKSLDISAIRNLKKSLNSSITSLNQKSINYKKKIFFFFLKFFI